MKGFTKDKKFHPIKPYKKKGIRKKRFDNSKIQSLIFNKKKFSMSEAKEWASDHGFKAVKVEPTQNNWRIRQFNPNKIKRGGECRTIQFGGSGVQGVLCEVPEKFRMKHDMERCPFCGEMKYLTGYGKCHACYAGNVHERKRRISDSEVFDDFWQEMSERGAGFEVLHEAGLSANEAVKGTPDEGTNMDYYHITPLEVGKEAQKKIIKSRGGIEEMMEFMAYNADWDKYKKELEREDK